MGFAQVCPICGGSGKVSVDYMDQWNRGSSKEKRDCQGCLGKGWVDVNISYPVVYPYYPQYPYQGSITWKWSNVDDKWGWYSNE